ncbi:NAD(P)-binding protein [Jaminaea rosea]|uniref:NAD(P)-binding protein n=1 Tax=Jaminaea rosea TaxID=1569628 RepID=A0A316UZ08_9BASI|nr:NAD(P)-binding protein [Jaminaea rosea]PWN29153.1 NAD(P)-binding protein [Jaminaea rosea]
MRYQKSSAEPSQNSLHRYYHANGASTSSTTSKKDKAPYALVTGSTGGIGEEWVHQLAALGFNVIAQGRNESKLQLVRSAVLARYPAVDVRLLVTEATIWPNEPLVTGLTALVEDDPSVRLTIVINNLGTVSTGFPMLEEESSESVAAVITSNAIFPAEIARICLPALKRHQPSLLCTVTSLGAWNPPPYLSPYAGTKGFDVAFSRSLWNEMAIERQDVDVVCLAPGQVVSGMHKYPPTLMAPLASVWTESAVAALRSTWWRPRPPPVVIPYRWHYWGQMLGQWSPSWLSDTVARKIAVQLKADYWEQAERETVDKKLL